MDKTEEGPSDGQDGGGSKIRATYKPRELEVIGKELRGYMTDMEKISVGGQ